MTNISTVALDKRDNSTVSFGDYIALYSECDLGYVAADSSSEVLNEPYVYSRQSYDLPENVSTMSMMLFEVCLCHRYKMDKRYRKLQQTEDINMGLGDRNEKLKRLKDAAALEKRDNLQVMKRNIGRVLRFGDIIQLKHVFSGYFLHINSNQLSKIQKSAFKTVLLPYSAKSAQFHVVPKYKVDVEGSQVHVGAYIAFESIASRSYYLHSNPNPLFLSSDLEPGISELNVSLEKNGFVVYKSRSRIADNSQLLMGLSIIHFYHQETEAYLSAEGYYRREVTEKIHMRIRRIDLLDVRSLTPSTNSNTYWEIEKANLPYSSDPVAWNDLVRLRHGSTRLYLSLNLKNKLFLANNIHDPRTVFKFHPVNKDRNEFIRKGINVRVEHVLSGRWLRVIPNMAYSKEEFAHNFSHDSAQVVWDNATFLSVSMDDDQRYDDAFNIEEVGEVNKDIFHKICGFVPIVKMLKRKISDPHNVNDESLIRYFSVVINEISKNLCHQRKPMKIRQKLLRCTKIIDWLFQTIELFGRLPYPSQQKWIKPCQKIFHLINLYIGSNSKNTDYVAKYFQIFTDTIWNKSPIVSEVVTLLTHMISSSSRVAEKVQLPHIKSVLQMVYENQNHVFLKFLSQTCSSRDVPIISNQDFIAQEWLVNDKTGLFLIKDGADVTETHNQLYISTNSGADWITIQNFFDKHSDQYSEEKCQFLLYQLDLFKAITLGRNKKVIEMITTTEQYITWPMTLACVQNEKIPDECRAKFCELIITLFLNFGSNFTTLEYAITAYSFENIEGNNKRILRQKREMHESFPVLRDWILQFVTDNQSMICEAVARNQLIIQVFHLLTNLIKFGYYEDGESIKVLIGPILNVLDGKNDVKFAISYEKGITLIEREELQEYHHKSRFEVSEANNMVVEAKNAGLEVLELLLMFQLNTRTQNLVRMFKDTKQSLNNEHQETGVNELSVQLFQENFDVSKSKTYSKDYKSIDAALKLVMNSTQYFNVERMREVVLDLTHYQNESLLHKSLLFLTRFFSSQEAVFSTSQDMMITYHRDSDTWLEMVQEFVPQLEILITGDWYSSAVNSFISMLNTIRAYCTLPSCNIPNVVFQKILYSCHVVDVLFKVFEKECGSKSGFATKKSQVYRKISKIRPENHGKIYIMYGETMDCLRVMAKEMAGIQNQLFNRLELIMSMENQTMQKKISLIKVIFADREDLVMNVSPHIIEWLFQWIKLNKECAPDIIDMILCLGRVQSSQKLIRNNMIWISKLIMKYWADFGAICDIKGNERVDLLTKIDNGPEKMFYVRMIYLMGVAGEMGLEFVESFCQSVLTLDNCMNMIYEVPDLIVQRSMLKFISELYIKSEVTTKQGGMVVTDVLFWNVIEQIKDTNVKWLSKLKGMSAQYHYDLLQAIREEQSLDDEDTMYMAWLMDGVIPFMTEALKTQSVTPETVYQQQLMIENTKLILHILTILAPNLSILHQVEITTNYMFASVLSNYERYMSLEPIIEKLSSNVRSDSVNSRQTLKEFLQSHAEEIEINREFKIFLKNTHSFLAGKNTAECQIRYSGPDNGVQKLTNQEYTPESTVEALPLGEEFQSLVQTFLQLEEIQPERRYANLQHVIRHLKMPLPRMAAKVGFTTNKVVKDQDSLNITCLRILRAVIQTEIKRLPADWAEHINDDRITVQLQYIRNLQSTLCQLHLFESVLHHSSRIRSPVTVELFAFLKVLLFNASTAVQENIYQFFIVSVTETFFFAIKEFLSIFEEDMKILRRNYNSKVKEKVRDENQFRVRRQTLTNMDLSVYYLCKEYFFNLDKNKDKLLNNIIPLTFHSIIDDGFGILLMQVLQSLCEGQFVKLQDYMRVQEDNPKSFNLVFRTCTVVNSIYSNINGSTIGILTQILGALNQMATGNQENRMTLVNGKIIDYINFILRTTEFNSASPEQVLDLREIVAKLVITLTEEDMPAARELAKEIMITVDKKAMFNIILQYYQFSKKDVIPNLEGLTTFITEKVEKKGIVRSMKNLIFNMPALRASKLKEMASIKERIYDIGFKYVSILMRFNDLDQTLLSSLPEEDVTIQHKAAFKGLKKGGKSIEVMKDDGIQRVHFRIKNRKIIREDLIETIKWDVDRSSNATKLRDFTNWADSVIMDLETSKKPNPMKTFIIQSWYLWNYLPVILSLVLNIMTLVTFESAYSLSNGPYTPAIHIPYPKLAASPDLTVQMMYLSTIHTVLSLILLVTYVLIFKPGFDNVRELKENIRHFFKRIPATDSITSNQNYQNLKKVGEKIHMLKENEQTDAINEYKRLRTLYENAESKEIGTDQLGIDDQCQGKVKSKLRSNVFGLKSFYYISFFLFSLVGTIFGAYVSKLTGNPNYYIAYYLFAFHLINIALVVTDLKGVFEAVRQSIPSMAWVGLLILIIIYVFNIIIFVFFRDSASMKNNLYCDTLGHCFATMIRFGFIFDKWMELFLPQFAEKKNFQSFIYLAIFTVLLCIIVAIIMLNIIAGIIVDKFASNRNLKDSKQEDMTNYCFICGRSSYEFETMAKGFRYHIMKEHNMWAYLYFLISLHTMKISDFTALQLHVHKMYKSKNLDFYPMDQAMGLAEFVEVTEEEKLKETSELLNYIIDDIDNSKLQKEQFSRRNRQEKWKKEALGDKDTLHINTDLQRERSVSMEFRPFDSAIDDIFDLEEPFCPSTNINAIPINMISFNPEDDSDADVDRNVEEVL